MKRAAGLCALALAACPAFDDAYDRCVADHRCGDSLQSAIAVTPGEARLSGPVGVRLRRELTVHNGGSFASEPLMVTLSADGFRIDAEDCSGAALATGADCRVSVSFARAAEGRSVGELRIGITSGPLARVLLEGVAVDGWPVSIALAGDGAGTVHAGDRSCPPDCTTTLARDAGTLLLTAAPAAGSRFTGWAGDCSGAGDCALTGGAARAVTATFGAAPDGVTLLLATDGPGRIGVSPLGTDCGPDCLRYPTGTSVTLSAVPVKDQAFTRWSGACPPSPETCALTLTADQGVTAVFSGPNVAFATSGKTTPGTLMGVDGGDAYCMAHARDAGFHAPFVAWLSVPGASALSRLGTARGWVAPDGKPFADRLAQSFRIDYPLEVDEHGFFFGNKSTVATGTLGDGTADPVNHCNGWSDLNSTFRAGDSSGGSTQWSDEQFSQSTIETLRTCGVMSRLYCLQHARTVPVPSTPVPAGGRRFFLAWLNVTGNIGGLTRADAICQNMATDAGLPGTYVAWLKPTGASTASRVAATGGDWYRPDGVMLATAATMRTQYPRLLAAPNVTAWSLYSGDKYYAWTGNVALDGGTDNCNGWTSTAAGSAITADYVTTEALSALFMRFQSCSSARPFFCAQY